LKTLAIDEEKEMNDRINQLFILLLVMLIPAIACQPDELLFRQGAAPTPTPTFTIEPSPTPILLPSTFTPTSTPEPTPTNTLVVQASYTPNPTPTDIPTPEPIPTDTPASEPPTPTEPAPEQTGPGTEIDWDDAADQPNMFPGQEKGYFIWTDGNRVHIRVATEGERLIFSGQATGNGAIVRIEEVAQEGIDITIREDVNEMDFQWAATGGPDGLDFTFTGDMLQLNLRIDGKAEPELVFVGADRLTLKNGLPLRLVR
jgi:hypothetical protein